MSATSTYQILIGGGITPGLSGSVAAFSGQLKKLVGAVAGLSIARQISAVLGSSISHADEMGRLAQKTGIATEALSGISHAAKLADVEMSTLQTALKGLSQHLASTGQGGKPLDQALLDVADQFQQMPDGAQKAAEAVKLFGKSGLDMIPMLNEGSAGLREMFKETNQFGITISSRFAKNADTFGDNLTRIKEAGRGFANMIADLLLPELIKTSKWFLDALKTFDLHGKALALITTAYVNFGKVAAALGVVMKTTMTAIMFPVDVVKSGSLAAASESFKGTFDQILRDYKERLEELDALGQEGPGEPGGRRIETRVAADRLTYLKGELDKLALVQAGIAASGKSAAFQARELQSNLQMQIGVLGQIMAILEERTQKQGDLDAGLVPTADEIKAQSEYNALLKEQYNLQMQVKAIQESQTFAGRMGSNIRALIDEWENFGKNFADVATNGIKRSIDAVSESITNAIMGVRSWGQAFAQVGTAIIGDIIRITVQWIASQTIMAALSKIFSKKAVSGISEPAAQAAVSWGPAATAASIATLGSAAGIGLGAMVAALAAGTAVASAASSVAGSGGGLFASGGYTGGGSPVAPAGIVHGREFVIPAGPTADFGVPFFEAIRRGQLTPERLAGGRTEVTLKMGVLNTRQQFREFLAEEGEAFLFDALRRRGNKFEV